MLLNSLPTSANVNGTKMQKCAKIPPKNVQEGTAVKPQAKLSTEFLNAGVQTLFLKDLATPVSIQVLELNARTRLRENAVENLAAKRLSSQEQNNSSVNARIVLSLILADGTKSSKNAKIPKVSVLERSVVNLLENTWQMVFLNAHALEATKKELAILAFGLELKIFAKTQNKSASEISVAKPNISLMEKILHADVLYATLPLADGARKKRSAMILQERVKATDAVSRVESFWMMEFLNAFAK